MPAKKVERRPSSEDVLKKLKEFNEQKPLVSKKDYTITEVAELLEIDVDGVQKFTHFLEKQGYVFLQGVGRYREIDVFLLRYMKSMRKLGLMGTEEAAISAAKVFKASRRDRTMSAMSPNGASRKGFDSSYDIDKLIETVNIQQQGINELIAQNKALMEQNQRLFQYIEDNLIRKSVWGGDQGDE